MHAPSSRALATWFLLALLHAPVALAFGKYDARDGDECRAQVNANFDAIKREMASHGNYRGIASMEERGRFPALKECDEMDRAVRDRRMREAYGRLTSAIETLRAGSAVSDAQKRALDDDHAVIVDYPASSYRDACLALHAEFVRYAFARAPSAGDCPAIRDALQRARREHDEAVDALLRRAANWRIYDKARQSAVAEMKWQQHLAQRAGCPAP